MKRLFLLLLVIFTVFSCKKDQNAFIVQGEIEGGEGKLVYLTRLQRNTKLVIDSTLIDENGKFRLNGTTELPNFYILEMNSDRVIHLAIHPGEEITVNTEAKSFGNPYIIYGSVDSERISRLIENQGEMFQALKQNFLKFQDSLGSPNIQQLIDLRDQKRDSIIENYTHYTKNFIAEKPGSFSSLMALYQIIGPKRSVLDTQHDLKYFKMVDSALMVKYPSSEPVKSLNQMIVTFENQMRALGPGDKAFNFVLPTPQGDSIMLSDLKGKFVLLDFWASWCNPCRQENPNLVKAYNLYSRYNFEIIQVSLDKTKDNWVEAIKVDSLTWLHVSDLKYWNSPLVQLYNVESIPSNYLLDPDQKIIAVNLMGDDLLNKLNQLFKAN